MADMETVLKGLDKCMQPGGSCRECPYRDQHPRHRCLQSLQMDAADLIRDQEEQLEGMEQLIDMKDELIGDLQTQLAFTAPEEDDDDWRD